MEKLAIIGASYLQLPLYLKAKQLGIKTIGFAWTDGAIAKIQSSKFYPISILEKEKIMEECRREDIDGVLTIASDIAVPTVTYVAENLGLISNSMNSSRISTNKFLMRQALAQKNLKCPTYCSASVVKDVQSYVSDLRLPLIVKPVDRSGSKGVTKVNNINELNNAVNRALYVSLCKQAIIEEFIEGFEVSVEAISFEGKHYILAITDKKTSGYPHFVELEHHQPTSLPQDLQNEIWDNTIKSLDALEIRFGASHSEFIINDNGIYVTEIGARMGGDFIGSDLVFLSTGYDFLEGIIDVVFNRFKQPVKQWQKYSGVYFHSSLTPHVGEVVRQGLLKNIIIKSEILKEPSEQLLESGDRSGYFVYQSNKRLILV